MTDLKQERGRSRRGQTQVSINQRLEEQFAGQCRFEILGVKLARNIAGIMIVGMARHEAELILHVPSSVQNRSAVVRGRFSYINDAGVRPPSMVDSA